MKRHKAVLLLLALGAVAGMAQSAAAGDTAAVRTAPKTFALRAMVSETGKTLMDAGEGKLWIVTNPELLRGYEGRLVSVQVEPGSAANELRIHSVRAAQAEVSHVNWGDAAFRR